MSMENPIQINIIFRDLSYKYWADTEGSCFLSPADVSSREQDTSLSETKMTCHKKLIALFPADMNKICSFCFHQVPYWIPMARLVKILQTCTISGIWNKWHKQAFLSRDIIGLTHLPLDKMAAIFADNLFKCIFMHEKFYISIQISLKFVPKGPIDNMAVLVQVMTRCCPGDKPISESIMVNLPTHICITRLQWVEQLLAISHAIEDLS